MGYVELLRRDLQRLIRCPECGATEMSIAGDERRVRCHACDSSYFFDLEQDFCSLLARSLDSQGKADIRNWWADLFRQVYSEHESLTREELDRRLDEMEELFRLRRLLAVVEMPLDDLDGKSVLEIGPGAGGHSCLFLRYGADVVAADITPERVASTALKMRLLGRGGRAYQADAENLPFRDESFDIVYSNGVLHCTENTEKAFDEVLRILRPGGKAVIMVYARHSAGFWLKAVPHAVIKGEIFRWPEAQWLGRVTEGTPRFGTTSNPYTRVYSERELRRLLHRFRIVELRKSSFQFDNFCVPRLTQIRRAVLKALGFRGHPGGFLVYGEPMVPETGLEHWLGRYIGFAWNVLMEKPTSA